MLCVLTDKAILKCLVNCFFNSAPSCVVCKAFLKPDCFSYTLYFGNDLKGHSAPYHVMSRPVLIILLALFCRKASDVD